MTETSDTSGSFTTDLISEIFTDVAIYKPQFISKLEFSFFHLCTTIIPGAFKTKSLNIFFSMFQIIQYFIVICQPSLLLEMKKGTDNETFSLMHFLINFWYNPNSGPTPIFYYIFFAICFIIIFLFILGIYLTYKSYSINSSMRILFSLFILNFTKIICIAACNYSVMFFCRLVINNETYLLANTIISIVLTISLLFINYLLLNSARQSIFFQNNFVEAFSNSLLLNCSSIMLSCTIYLGSFILNNEKCLSIQGILFLFFAVLILYIYIYPINFHNHVNAAAISMAITMITSAVFSFYQANKIIEDNYMVVFILFLVMVASFLVVELIYHFYTKKIKNDFQLIDIENPDFSVLRIKSPNMLLTYLTVALTEGYHFVCNGKFISWVAHNYNSEPILIKLVRTTCIIPLDQDDYNIIFHNFDSHCAKSISSKYLLYSLFILNSIHSTSHVPPKIRPIIKLVEGRMSEYQSIGYCFSNSLTDDSNVNFLLFDSLGTMKNLLKRNTKYLMDLYPNSPEALMLYQSYQLKVKRNKLKADKYNDLIQELLKGSVLYNDANYIQVFSGYQRIQRTLFTLHSNSNYNATAFPEQYDGKANVALKNDFNQRKRKPFQTNSSESAVDFYHSKGLVLNKIMLIIFAFFVISVFVSLFGGFGISTVLTDMYSQEIKLVIRFRDLYRSFFSFYFRPLMLFTYYDENSTDEFINDQIAQAFNGIKDLRERLFDFREILQTLAQSYSVYINNFIYLYDKSFLIPSYYDDVEVNTSIGVYFTRITSSLFPFFKDNQTFAYNYSSYLRQSFIRIIDVGGGLFYDSISNLSLALETFTYQYEHWYFINFVYILIPFFVFIFILFILPIFYIKLIKTTNRSFAAHSVSSNKKTLEYYLRSKFYTMKQFMSIYYIYLFLFLVLNILYQFLNCYSLKSFVKHDGQHMTYHVINDLETYYYLTSPLSIFCLSNLTQGNYLFRYTLINDCLDYFMQATSGNQTIDFSRASYDIFRFLDALINVVTINNYLPTENITNMILKLNQNEAQNLVSLLDESIFPILIEKYDNTYNDYKFSENWLTYNTLLGLSFFNTVLMVVLLTSFYFIVQRLRALLSLIHNNPYALINPSLIKNDSSSSVSSSTDRLEKNLMNRKHGKIVDINDDIIFYDENAVYNHNLLGLLNKPAVLIDLTNDNNIVVQANKLWLDFFDCTEEYAIGRAYTDFRIPSHKYPNNSYQYIMSDPISLYELNLNFSMHCESAILYVDTIPVEDELDEQIELLKNKIIGIRANHFPARFINRNYEGAEHVGFHINLSIMLEPISNYEVNPDLWNEDIGTYGEWIRNKCRQYDNIDVLNYDSRELTILFGLNKDDDHLYLALTAMTIACDALRWGIEYDWRIGNNVNVYMILTSGESADFVFRKFDNTLTLNMFGPAFYRKMTLREDIRPNSIIISTYVSNLIKSSKIGFHVEEINANACMFSIPSQINEDIIEM